MGGALPASGSETPWPGTQAPSPSPPPSGPSPPPFERLSSGPKATAPGTSPMIPAPTASLSSDVMGWDTPHSQSSSWVPADVKIQHSPLLNYWLVTIASKDRNKLFFDTVCTFADCNYDVFHSTIDSEGDAASQLFYVRPRYGEAIWDAQRAHKLKYMLESAVQRRFPKGLKIHVQATDQRALLDLFQQLSAAGFWITRAEVRCHQDVTVYHFSVTDTLGHIPSQGLLQSTCEMAGGTLVEDLDVMAPPSGTTPAQAAAGMLMRTDTMGPRQLPAFTGHARGGGGAQRVPAGCRFAFSFPSNRVGTGGGTTPGGSHRST